MEPLLNKFEIAELLKAIRQGHVSLGQNLNSQQCTPINLFQLSRPAGDDIKIPNFDIIMDGFARHYAVALSNQLQKTISITRTELQTYEYQSFIDLHHSTGAIGMLNMPPLKHGALVFLDPSLSFSFIEIMLGGSIDVDTLKLNRKLTTIELSVLKVIFDYCCPGLDKSFQSLISLRTDVTKIDNNPRLMSITEPDEEVIVCSFQVKFGNEFGQMRILFPIATLEVLFDDLQHLVKAKSKTSNNWKDILTTEVQDLVTTLTAQLTTKTMTVREVTKLTVGDVIEINYDPNKALTVLVEDKPKFFAIPGTHNDQKAINLTDLYHR